MERNDEKHQMKLTKNTKRNIVAFILIVIMCFLWAVMEVKDGLLKEFHISLYLTNFVVGSWIGILSLKITDFIFK